MKSMGPKILVIISLLLAFYVSISELWPEIISFSSHSSYSPKAESQLDQKSQITLSKTCQLFHHEFKNSGFDTKFQKVVIQARDERIQNHPFLKELYSCFHIEKMASQYLEIEAFTSDFEGQLSDDLQLQVSVFDFVTQNKLTEFGFVYQLVANEPQDSEASSILLKQ